MKPMLAAQADLAALRYPLYASPKLDGVRGLVIKGRLHSRSLKLIPNPHVDKLFSRKEYDGMDGELILGNPTAKDVYRVTNGACQRDTGAPGVKFYVFDRWDRASDFGTWFHSTKLRHDDPIVRVEQFLVKTAIELLQYESDCLTAGYEGLILRSPEGKYKFGRSTAKEQGMLKLKRFVDGEARVIGIEEEMHNANEAKRNALGRTERSSHQSGMVGTGRMGALVVCDLVTGVEFGIGTGFSAADRDEQWKIGDIVKYKHFEVGAKDKPRFPVFLGRRMKEDM